jgi:hypothetical protein
MASEPLPSYTRPNHNPAFASSEEELAALKEWVESKKYVTPGTDGTLPAMDRGGYGLLSLVWGGPLETGPGPATIPESPAQRLAALERLDAAKGKEEEKSRHRKPSLGQKVKRFVQGRRSEEERRRQPSSNQAQELITRCWVSAQLV